MKKLWFSSKTFFDFNFFPSVSILIFVFLISTTRGGPLTHHPPETDLEVGNNSLVAPAGPPHPVGCRYQGSLFAPGEDVVTEEPCLVCQCKSAVVCKLRICPETPDPPPPGCIVVHKAKKCCAQLVCNQNLLGHETNRKLSREQKLPAVNSSLSTTLAAAGAEGKGFCVVDGTVYAEGSAMRSSSLCQYCFCIRGEMKCSKPQCVIPMNGCKPRFRSYACCPTNYDCQDSNSTAVVKTTPTSTPIPHFLKGCLVNGKKIAEGEPVLPLQLENHTNPCQTCFCMGGVIHCRQLECDRPIEGCKPITEHGHCCPDRYDCSNLNKLNSKSKSHQIQSANLIKAPTNSVESTSTTSQVPSTTTTSSTTVSSTTIETASTTTTTIAPSTTTTSATTTTATPTTTPIPTTTTTTTMPTTTTTTAAAPTTTTTTTTATTPKILTLNTTEKAEILPVPASMKMTTAEDPSVLVAASGERKLNANSRPRNKSDAGSREDRQNKDRNHFRYRTSYEDDEKEDSASLSYENTEHENLDPNSSLSYEETTDHSGSNSDSEMDNDNAEIAPTEENSVEIEVEGRNDSMESEGKTSLPLQSEVEAEETTNQKLLAGTGTNTNALTDSDSDSDTGANTEKENDTEPKEIKVKKLGTKNPTGSTPSLTDFLTSTTTMTTTTTMGTVATSVNPSSTPNPTTVVVSNMSEGVSLAGGDSLKEVEATNTSSLSSFSGLSQGSSSGSGSGSDSDAEITGSSIINQDVENTEVTSSASPTTTETATTTTAPSSVIFTNATTTTTAPTTTSTTTTTTTTAPPSTSTNPSPSSESVQGQGQPQPTSETTVKNVHFISFGVEDAVVSPMNETAPHFESQLTYDNNALKISLIPPTPPKGYPKRIHSSHHHNSSKGPSSHMDTSSPPSSSSSQGGGEAVNSIIQSSGAGSGPGRKDELGNAIMDVPVSTSLYNNGFYRSGGMIITDDSQRGSIELEISSNRPFPGQVFDDGDHSHGIQKQHGMASPPPAPAPGPGPAPVPAQVPAPAPAPAPVSIPVPVPASAPESQSNSHKKAHFDSPPLPLLLTSIKPPYPSSPLPTLSDNNPARTYSKFGIQDSTYYRYGYGNGNGNNNGNPPPPTRAHVNMNPHNSPIPNQHQQYHHRYYNAPEHEHFVPQNPYAGFEQVINQDQDQEDVTYEEVDDDDVGEGVSFEEQEQSLEAQNQNPEIENLGNNQFNYQKKPGTVSTLRPLPTFVFPQNPLEETSTPIYNSSTKIQIQIPPKSHSQQQNSNQNQNQYTQQNPIASGTKKVPGYNYNYNYNKHQQQLQLPQQQPQKPQQQGHGQGSVGFKPAVAFPFALPKKPAGLEFNLGLKLSGCNIYGKMYNVEDVILELSSSCVRCLCTEMGVQCSEILC